VDKAQRTKHKKQENPGPKFKNHPQRIRICENPSGKLTSYARHLFVGQKNRKTNIKLTSVEL